ncbi:phage tail protein [Sinorhizobium fredii]|nr:phage tail protein [Sinorhizobium fredii]
MKYVRLLFASGASFVAMTSHAHADPVSLIATAIHGFLLSSTAVAATAAGTIATFAANAIVVGALAGLSLFGAGQRPTGTVKAADAKGTFESGESSVIEGLGRVRVGGLKAFGNTDGSTRWRLVCRLQGPIDAVEAYFVGGREVTVDPDGDVSSPPWSKAGGSWMKWQDKVGNGGETAWPALITAFPELWTSAHRVRGIAQSLVTFFNPGLTTSKYLSLYQGGVPDTEWVTRASRIYDPRDEDADPDNDNTWGWSENGILCAVHVLRRDPAFTSDRFDWPLITTQAVKADVSVATKTGTEKRARCWGMWAWEGARKETMEDILRSIGAEIRMTAEGKIWLELIDDNPTPEISFEPRDIIDLEWAAGPEAVERPNICRIKYYSPERNYELADLDLTGIAWARIDDEVTRYGTKYFDAELPFCPSASQAQRIARRLFLQARGDTGVAAMNMVGLAAWGVLYGEIELPDLGDVEKVRLSPPRVDDSRGTVEIPFAVWPSLPAWNPATDEANAPDQLPEMGYESTLPTPDAPGAALQITYPVSGDKEFRIAYSLPAVSYSTIEATYRAYSGGLPGSWTGMTEQATFAYVADDLEGMEADARVRIFNGDDGSYYSDLLHIAVTEHNSPCAAPDVVSGGATGGTEGIGTLAVVVDANELRCASIKLQRRVDTGSGFGAWSTRDEQDVRPGQDRTFNDSYGNVSPVVHTVEWKLTTMTSGGVEGTPRTFSVDVSQSI